MLAIGKDAVRGSRTPEVSTATNLTTNQSESNRWINDFYLLRLRNSKAWVGSQTHQVVIRCTVANDIPDKRIISAEQENCHTVWPFTVPSVQPCWLEPVKRFAASRPCFNDLNGKRVAWKSTDTVRV